MSRTFKVCLDHFSNVAPTWINRKVMVGDIVYWDTEDEGRVSVEIKHQDFCEEGEHEQAIEHESARVRSENRLLKMENKESLT